MTVCFAKVGGDERRKWGELISEYLKCDEGLELAVVLLDARHGPTQNDEEAIEFLVSERVPVMIVFTKCDSLKNQSERVKRHREAGAALV